MRYLSLGAGVQSSALLILSIQGKVPRADVAIFADTGDEPEWVYQHLARLEGWSSIPIVRVSAGCISEDLEHKGLLAGGKRFASIPLFTRSEDGTRGILRRQCTREYKITPIEQEVRKLLGYKKGQIVKEVAKAMIGISLDEVTRMKPSRIRWIENEYPLVDLGLRRSDCSNIVIEAGFPPPKKSSCFFCPFHSDAFWLELRENYPKEWNKAVAVDKSVRNMTERGPRAPVFLHSSLVPLEEVEFKHENQMDLFDNECEGMCGV